MGRRPEFGPKDRVRVEFRLPRAVAEAAYRCACEWNVSLSEAGTRLIESGFMATHASAKPTGAASNSYTLAWNNQAGPTSTTTESGGTAYQG